MAGHVMNFFNGVHHAKKLINQGVIGKVLYCHTARNGWDNNQPFHGKKFVNWRSTISCVQNHYGWQKTVGGPPMLHKNLVMKTITMEYDDNRFAVQFVPLGGE